MTFVDIHRFILAAIIAMARIGGAFAICPALTENMIPGTARRASVLGFAAIVLPIVLRDMPPGQPNLLLFIILALKEALIGFVIGFFAAVPFWIAENIGNFIDNQRGATMGEVYSPLSGAQVSTIGIFFTQLVSTIFFIGGVIFIFLAAIYKSYRLWPVFGQWMAMSENTPAVMLGTLDSMLKTTVVIAAPVIILMFLVTIGLGFINRTAPQLNVFFLSMPVKSAMGIGMLIIYLPFIMDMLIYTDDSSILNPVLKLFQG